MTVNPNKIYAYEVINFEVTADNIKKFQIMPDRRLLNDAHVKKLHSIFQRKGRFPGTLAVNKLDSDLMILMEGNHRLEACKRFFDSSLENSKKKIPFTIDVYKNLSTDEMRAVFRTYEKKSQSYEDLLNLYKSDIQLWKLIQTDFPCKVLIYSSDTAIRFRVILNALSSIKNSPVNSFTPQDISRDNIVNFADTVSYDDYMFLKEFFEFFQDVYGQATKQNVYIRTLFLTPIMHIYYTNKEQRKKPQFEERFRRIMNKPEFNIYLHQSGSRENRIRVRQLMIDCMNFHTSENKFK